MTVNRVTMHLSLPPSGNWVVNIFGWRENNTTAWRRQITLSASDSATLPELFDSLGCMLQAGPVD